MTFYRNADPQAPILRGKEPLGWRLPPYDWDRAPWNRWTFQNIRMCVPTEEIARGPDALEWQEAPQDLSGVAFTGWDGKPMTLADLLADYADGFLVAHRGRILHESYHNGMTRGSRHLLMSVSKSITATTVGILIDRGLLDPAAPMTEYLPELAATGWKGATLQQVLDMTTGVRFVEDYEDPDCDVARLEFASGWKPLPPHMAPGSCPDNTWDYILSLTECEAAHGARFSYRSIETDLLGVLIARVSGQSFARTVSEVLWAPMGAETGAYVTVDRNGTPLADGGICASLRDCARFGQTMLDGGRAGGRQVIPSAWIEDVRGGDHGRFDDQSREFMPNGRYRNMFWIRDVARPVHISLGIYGQVIYVDPEHELVVACQSSWPESLSDSRHSNTMRAIDAIAAALS
ncbi:serine hydrolase [Ruegeria sp. PrR005]|uniref:Serine hydrolase n=1 Tax=Ruegeria sp. PrR005 TaxID=2706882 RepID=A0A6B2NPL1_9RHOB|nr:serine hydrolase [Ruegeria sp. PrR005]NDW46061.1 serine hydrolase [Ruegeria sp. PrR005]